MQQDYITEKLGVLREGTRLPFNVFFGTKNSLKPLLYKGTPITSLTLKMLEEKEISGIYISKDEEDSLDRYISGQINSHQSCPAIYQQFFRHMFYREAFHKIDRAVLVKGAKIIFSIYGLKNLRHTLILEAAEHRPASITDAVLNADGEIYIKSHDLLLYQEYLTYLLNAPEIPSVIKRKIKISVVKENARIIVKEINYAQGDTTKASHVQSTVHEMIGLLNSSLDFIFDIGPLKQHDIYSYLHSVNVTILSLGLGKAIGLDNYQLEKLGTGVLLHDIGKRAIPSDVLCNIGQMSDSEFVLYKSHVDIGENFLKDISQIPEESCECIRQHHERISGSGYPRKLKGKEIHIFGKIAAIADTYDYLSTPSPSKYAYSPAYAMSIMTRDKVEYDGPLLSEFIKMVGPE